MACTLVARAGLEVICLAIYSTVLEAINNLSHLPSEGVESLQAINDLSYICSFTDNFRGERCAGITSVSVGTIMLRNCNMRACSVLSIIPCLLRHG